MLQAPSRAHLLFNICSSIRSSIYTAVTSPLSGRSPLQQQTEDIMKFTNKGYKPPLGPISSSTFQLWSIPAWHKRYKPPLGPISSSTPECVIEVYIYENLQNPPPAPLLF